MMRLLGIFLLITCMASPVLAQSMTVDLGDTSSGTATARLIQLIVLMTIISLAPSILIMMTSFLRIVIVLSFLRSALGLQQTPPNVVLISLALFLTSFIMAPAFEKAYTEGMKPLLEEEIDEMEALEKIGAPFHEFMLEHVREKDLQLFMDMAPEVKVEDP
ncbi:MAG: flagellar biosynthetic protein FliP, partial [Alphaproteobacteria bacterium]